MTRSWILALIVFAGVAARASAETWLSDLELMADRSTGICAGIPTEHWKLDLSGSTLSGGYTTGGTLFTTETAPDGSVDLTFKLPAVSTLEKLSGNAASRQLFLSNTLYACVWKFVPPKSASSQ